MDFGMVSLDHHHHHHHQHQLHHHNNSLHNGLGVSSSSSSEPGFASSNVISSSSSPDPDTTARTFLYGSELSSSQGKPEKSSGSGLDDYWRSSKVAKTGSDDDFSPACKGVVFQQRNNNNSNSGSVMRSSNNSSNSGNNSNNTTTTTTLSFLDNNNNNGGYNSHSQQHQMLSFSSSSSSSSPTKSEAHALPYFSNALPASYSARTTGYNMYQQQHQGGGGMMMMMRSGPFTASQWMELEHQALIYKYITAAVPIPSNLIIPIRKAFDSAFPPSLLRSNPLGGGWGSAFHLGFSNNADPEPGRCRRTDGKKWRCSRDAMPDQKYCERHMNRGRHRSRKPVEGPAAAALAVKTDAATNNNHNHATNASSAPANRMFGKEAREFGAVTSVVDTNSLHQFIDSWPERTQLSISIPGGGGETNLSPLRLSNSTGGGESGSWMSSSLGGPLGEALNLMPDGTSPTGVLQKPAFGSHSNSSAGSSPVRVDVHPSSSSLPPPAL